MLGAIESLMSAVVADRMSGDRHNPNMELVAQGVANIVSPLFGGLPATGAIARTATNIRSGARTPVAGMVHALTLLADPARSPRRSPASSRWRCWPRILMVVAYNMGEWREIPELLRADARPTSPSGWSTFALTVFADLTVAVEVGMVLAALLFIRRVAETTTVAAVTDEYIKRQPASQPARRSIPPYVRIFRIHGPFLFGATDKLHVVSDNVDTLPEIVILRLRNMTALDATGPARVRGARRRAARVGARAAAVRRAAAAGAPDGARRVSPARRRREHLRQHRRRARARRDASQRARRGSRAAGSTGGQRMSRPSHELQTLKAEFFRALAHPVRIRLLEVLVGGRRAERAGAAGAARSRSADRLAAARAGCAPAASSSAGRKGTTVQYALADPRIADLLGVAKAILNRRLTNHRTLLHELRRQS